MRELTTALTRGGSSPAAAPTAAGAVHDPRHHTIECTECFEVLLDNRRLVDTGQRG